MLSYQPPPVVLVTGASSGLGFSVCQRLIEQLSYPQPPDAIRIPHLSAYFPHEVDQDGEKKPLSYDGLTIIMACRSMKRAEAAKEELHRRLELYITRKKADASYNRHAEKFKSNLNIYIHLVDLGSWSSVVEFCAEIDKKYTYVSHAIFNAGTTSFSGINWPVAIKELLLRPVYATTYPIFKKQRKGELSADGLGWVWQCNVFGHYVMYRGLENALRRFAKHTSQSSRVIWLSSLQSNPCYEPDDWQLIRTCTPYEATKFQTDLLAGYFEEQQQSSCADAMSNCSSTMGPGQAIHHILVEPGVVATSIFHEAMHWCLIPLMVGFFYLARLLGSPHHPINPFIAAFAPVHLCLVPLPTKNHSSRSIDYEDKVHVSEANRYIRSPPKFGSQASRWGHPLVGVSEIEDWVNRRGESVELVERCECLHQSLLKAYTLDNVS